MSDHDLLARLRRRLLGGGAVGEGFDPSLHEDWEEITDQASGVFQFVGSAVVATWEVGLAELGRSARARLPEDEAETFLERTSDALVPTLQPVQGAGKRIEQAMQAGWKQAERSGRMLDAFAGSVLILRGLGAEVGEGWDKTIDYLAPELARLPDSEGLAGRLREGSGELQKAFDEPAEVLQKALGELPEAFHFGAAAVGAFEDYRTAICRSVELEIYARRQLIMEQLAELPER